MPLSKKRLINSRNGTLNNSNGKKSGLVSRIGKRGTFRWFKVNRACCIPCVQNISIYFTDAFTISIHHTRDLNHNDFQLLRSSIPVQTTNTTGPETIQMKLPTPADDSYEYQVKYNGNLIAHTGPYNKHIKDAIIDTNTETKLYVYYDGDLSFNTGTYISQNDLFSLYSPSPANVVLTTTHDLSSNTDISNNIDIDAGDKYDLSRVSGDYRGVITLLLNADASANTQIDISYGKYIPSKQADFPDSSGSIFDKNHFWIVGISSELQAKNPNINVKNHIRGKTGTLGSHLVDLSLNFATSTKIDLSLNFDSDISFNVDNFSLDISFNFRDISNSWKRYTHNVLVPQLSNNSKTIVIDISGISGNSISTNTIAKDIEISWNDISGSTFNIDISGIENVVYTKIDSKYLLPINNDYIKTSGGNTVKHVNGNRVTGTFTSTNFLASQSSGGADPVSEATGTVTPQTQEQL